MHIWGVPSPHPQQMPLAAFALRMMRLPTMPAAPPLQVRVAPGFSAFSERRVTIESELVRVPPLQVLTIPPRTLRAQQIAVPAGTSGRLVQTSTTRPSPVSTHVPAAPLVKSSDAARVPASAPAASARPSLPGDSRVGPASAPPRPEMAGRSPESTRTAAVATSPVDGTGEKERAQKDQEVVLAVLREYSRAYERLDVRATKAVYPSIDDRRLRRAFDDLQQQQVRFASCGVTISSSGAGASAWCKGDASFRPKVGSPRYYPNREWTFSLTRDGAGWQILKAMVQ
jgi:hypothetical protein